MKFDQEDSTNGIVYLWVGSKADPEDIKLAEEISDDMFNDVNLNEKIFFSEYNKFLMFYNNNYH